MPTEEQKRIPRLIVSLTVVLSKKEALYVVETENVSDTGLRLHSKEVFPVGTQLHLVFGQPPELPRITADGIVRWSDVGKGMGVEFTSISADDRQVLLKFVTSQTRSEQA